MKAIDRLLLSGVVVTVLSSVWWTSHQARQHRLARRPKTWMPRFLQR